MYGDTLKPDACTLPKRLTPPPPVQADGSLKATLKDGSTVDADCIMYATGRKPRTANLGCDKAGVKLDDNGAIMVDEAFQTSVSTPPSEDSAQVGAIGFAFSPLAW